MTFQLTDLPLLIEIDGTRRRIYALRDIPKTPFKLIETQSVYPGIWHYWGVVQLARTSGFDPENVGSNPATPIY